MTQTLEIPARKFPRALALSVARGLMDLLEPYCVPGRLAIAGSLRRGRALVGDVEICYVSKVGDIAKPGEMFAAPGLLADAFINELRGGKLEARLSELGKETWGALNKLAVHKATELPVDLFREPNEADWWRTLVIRTGPKDFNLRLIASARARGLSVHAYGPGITDGEGQPVACGSEADFLEICGLGWIEPKDRA